MGVLVTLLVVAYIPTADTSWIHDDLSYSGLEAIFGSDRPSGIHQHSWTPGYSRHAICLFRDPTAKFLYDKLSVGISILYLVGAFITRLVSLHRYLVRDILGRMRAKCSSYVQLQLLKVWQMFQGNKWHDRLARRVLYQPLLVSLLCFQVYIDLFTSKFVDVCQAAFRSYERMIDQHRYGR